MTERRALPMLAADVLAQLRQQGITLFLAKGALRYQAPKDALTDDMRQFLRQYKAELIAMLQGADTGDTGNAAVSQEAGPSTYTFTNPQTGQKFVSHIYTCPTCGGADWGPMEGKPGVWHCRTCALRTELANSPLRQPPPTERPLPCPRCGGPQYMSHETYDKLCNAYLEAQATREKGYQ